MVLLLLPFVAAPLAKFSGLAFGPLFLVPPFILRGAVAAERRRSRFTVTAG